MNKHLKRLLALSLSSVMLASSVSILSSAEETVTDNSEMPIVETAEADDSSYESFIANNTFANATEDISVDVNANIADTINFNIEVPTDGAYNFALSYKGLGDETGNLIFDMKIDGVSPFTEAKKLNLFRIYQNDPSGNRVDGLGNEFAPKQIVYDNFYYDIVTDITRWSDTAYLFPLTAGTHTVTLTKGEGDFAVEKVVFLAPDDLKKYEKPTDTSKYYDGKSIILEGEDAKIKTGYWLAGKSDNSSLDVTPNDASKTKTNYIGGGNWKTSGQTLTWETPEMEAGYYNLGFSYRQSTVLGAKVYRNLRIDGETPFKEAASVGFKYSYKWEQDYFADDNGNPYLIYIPAGKHEISLEVTSGDITVARDLLKQAVADLGALYVDITMITGESVDIYRDYELFTQISDMQDRLTKIKKNLDTASAEIQRITGEKSGSYISVINSMSQICKLMLDNKYTAHRYKDEYYSKYTSLASVLFEMSEMPLDIDKISFTSPSDEKPFEKSNIFQKALFSVEKFFVSFTQDYNNISGTEENEENITIWVNWGRDQAQVLNALIQAEFTPQTGIGVNVQLVNATVVQAVLSGKGPDCLLEHSRSEPVNLAMRGMLYDLKSFDDCDEVLKNFHEGAELPYYYKGGLYGLPDTQSFYLMFYRTDIFDEMGLEVPETWDDFREVVKLLARNNLTAWLPNNTATSTAQANIGIGSINLFPTLLLQRGLEVYKEDGRATNLTDSDVIMAFSEWTDMYSKLKLPRTLDFYNRFRTGTTPIGMNAYTLYTTLKAAAPEIDGLWNVALVPGTEDENGNVDHTTSGGGAACSILNLTKNPDAAWTFLKWWVTGSTQLAFSSEVESILGPTGRKSVSNVSAFESMEWDADMRDVIVEALNDTKEIPEYPGSYYVSRSVYQAFWNVVENNQNTKKMLLKYAEEANEEIARKWKQYENR